MAPSVPFFAAGGAGADRSTGYRIEGARQLRRTLKAAGREVTDLKGVHLDVARIVATEARRRAPVRTGTLRDSLKPAGYTASAIIRAASRTVPYGNPVHWGWARRGIRPNPFVLEAADARREEVENAYLRSIEKITDSIKGDNRR